MDYKTIESKLVLMVSEVLDIENVKAEDDFFELDGDSIDAIELLALVFEAFEVEISIDEVFSHTIISELAIYIFEKVKDGNNAECTKIKKVESKKENIYPISSVQNSMYALNQFERSVAGYNVSRVKVIEGKIDIDKFQYALNKVVERHESLRTSFILETDGVKQKVNDNVTVNLIYKEINEQGIDEFVDDFIKPFDLSEKSLLRVALLKCSEEKHIFVIDMHHIITDNTSIDIFVHDLMHIYFENELSELKVQFKDYVAWQNTLYSSENNKEQEKFWIDSFKVPFERLNLTTDYQRPSILSFRGNRVMFEVDCEFTNKLKAIASREDTTLFMLLVSVYNLLLFKYTGQNDIIVGMPMSGRTHPDTKNIIGMFVNTLPLRTYPVSDKSFQSYLNECKKVILNTISNQQYTLDKLVSKLDYEREPGRNPIFDVCFNMLKEEDYDLSDYPLKINTYDYKRKRAVFDLTLVAIETKNSIKFEFEYSTELYKEDTVKAFANDYFLLLEQISLDCHKKLENYEINNYKHSNLPLDRTLHSFFEQNAKNYPDRIAVVDYKAKISYEELNKEANQLASILVNKCAGKEQVVGLIMDRTIDMIIGILAILKSGAAYLPIDSNYPENRVRLMLDESNVKILITKDELIEKVKWIKNESSIDIISVDDVNKAPIKNIENLGVRSNSDNLSYIIYTSGSTGKPKGIMIEHRNVINFINGIKIRSFDKYPSPLNVGLVAPYVFDASIQQIFPSLVLGHTLYITPDDVKVDPNKFRYFLYKNKIDITDGTPAHLKILLSGLADDENIVPVKQFLIGGEGLPTRIVKTFLDKCVSNKTIITNVYGPTECCVEVTAYTIENAQDIDCNTSIVYIGTPMQNSQIYIIDEDGQEVPDNTVGEIYIAGKNVGRGYINNKKLTEERFIPNPYKPGEYIYKTGDLGRRLSNGNIEFQGRIDHQVKINGFRIELGEIENTLLKHSDIQEAVVVEYQKESGDNSIATYIVSKKELSVKDIHTYLSNHLPEYMIPAYFVFVDKLPLTINGKIDRKRLPNPQEHIAINADYEEPRNEVEKILVDIWKEILCINKIGIKDNFFNLGGDSIKAIMIAANLQKYKMKIDIIDFFENPTIKQLSNYVKISRPEINQNTVEGVVPLTPIQKWFFEQNFDNMNHWNQSVVLYSKNRLDKDYIEKVFMKIIEHHDALRMVYCEKCGQIEQYNRGLEDKLLQIHSIELLSENNINDIISNKELELHKAININDGPLVQLAIYKLKDGDYLQIIIHHLVVDGVSWRILLDDFKNGYYSLVNKQEINFLEKTDSFMTWSHCLNDYSKSDNLLRELDYWNNIEKASLKDLPKDCGDNIASGFEVVSTDLSKEITEKLLKDSNKAYNTEITDLLLSGLVIAINRWCGNNELLVELEGHGREEISQDLNINRTVGWFTSMYPVLLRYENDEFSNQIIAVKEALHNVPNKGVGYSIIKYLTPSELRNGVDFKQNPEISFNYLGQFINEIDDNFTIAKGIYLSKSDISKGDSLHFLLSIEDGRLKINLNYDTSQYSKETALKILNIYHEVLIQVIEHCVYKEDVQLTPSDLSYQGLSVEELDELSDLINI